MRTEELTAKLSSYQGNELKIMEVCGTHTAAIFKQGIKDLISPDIRLISGPGCPVCVTPASWIDRAVAWAKEKGCVLAAFGDMMKVPGSHLSLSEAKGEGANVLLMYSPQEVIQRAKENPQKQYIIAAVGFETTIPVYALALEQLRLEKITNVRFLTALRAVVPVLRYVCEEEREIRGFLAPGHVSTLIGAQAYQPLAKRYEKPFTVGGFTGQEVLLALYDLLRQIEKGTHEVHNAYPAAVRWEGNPKGMEVIGRFFQTEDAAWRGLGDMRDSGYYLRPEYGDYDAGSRNLPEVQAEKNPRCRCGEVILGKIAPPACPLFGRACTPARAQGPCMVSGEGACGIWHRFHYV